MDLFIILLFTIAALVFSYKTTKVKDFMGKISILGFVSIALITGLFRFEYISSKTSMRLILVELIIVIIIEYILKKRKKKK